jgi:TonB family protein
MKIKNKYLLSFIVFSLVIIVVLFVSQDNLTIVRGKLTPNQYYLSDSSKAVKQHVTDQLADEMPQLINQVMPKYPKKALIEKLECVVYIRVLVDESGNPIKSEIMKREGGSKEFEDSVTVSAMKSKFSPAKDKGNPVEAWVVIPYKFKLK